jgi:thioredoxin reductase (NADPH)
MIELDDVRGLYVFAGLSEEALRRVTARGADLWVHAQEYLVHEGEVASFYVLLTGKVELTKRQRQIERVLTVRSTPGDYFGEIPLLIAGTTFANLRTVEPSRLLRLEADDFRRLVAESPAFAARMIDSMRERVAGVQQVTVEDSPVTAVVAGRRWDPACHDLRDFLARNHVSFDYYDIDDPAAVAFFPDFERRRDHCPLVQIYAGPLLENPTPRALAEALHIATIPKQHQYDVAIVGGGPAGLAAALYGASEGLSTVLFEREAPGGQAGTSSRIENYLGFPTGLSGDDLAARAIAQAERFGADLIVTRTVREIVPGDDAHALALDGNDSVRARAVVIAAGVAWRTLSVPGIDRFTGAGVFYGAALTEAIGMRGKDAYLIGAGNSAGQAAMFFASYARSVTLVVRGDSLAKGMSDYLIKELATKDNIHVELESEVVAAEGGEHLEAIEIEHRPTASRSRRETAGLFVFIGADAQTEWLPRSVARDARGYVLTGVRMRESLGDVAAWTAPRDPYFLETSVPGIFAAGDVRATSVKRCAAAVGEGSMAIAFVHQYLEQRASLAVP